MAEWILTIQTALCSFTLLKCIGSPESISTNTFNVSVYRKTHIHRQMTRGWAPSVQLRKRLVGLCWKGLCHWTFSWMLAANSQDQRAQHVLTDVHNYIVSSDVKVSASLALHWLSLQAYLGGKFQSSHCHTCRHFPVRAGVSNNVKWGKKKKQATVKHTAAQQITVAWVGKCGDCSANTASQLCLLVLSSSVLINLTWGDDVAAATLASIQPWAAATSAESFSPCPFFLWIGLWLAESPFRSQTTSNLKCSL